MYELTYYEGNCRPILALLVIAFIITFPLAITALLAVMALVFTGFTLT